MLVLCSVFVAAIDVFILIKPELIYQLRETWKNNSVSEPSKLYLIMMRINGGLFTIVGVVGFVLACIL